MTVVAHINPEKFAKFIDPETSKVLKILKDHHIPYRIVGGAVRDILRKKAPRDIDLVVDADPSEIVYLFEMYTIPTDLGGIAHGTVKAVFGYGDKTNKIEVTSLGYRIKLQNEKPKIDFADDWAKDAAMRDITINSMSMDKDGDIYDYTGGYKDLMEQRIRMLNHTKENIESDPNTLMRYFRSLTYFTDPKMVKSDLEFVKKNSYLLADKGDDKRLTMNMITIQKSPNYKKIVGLMCKMGLKKYLPYLPC